MAAGSVGYSTEDNARWSRKGIGSADEACSGPFFRSQPSPTLSCLKTYLSARRLHGGPGFGLRARLQRVWAERTGDHREVGYIDEAVRRAWVNIRPRASLYCLPEQSNDSSDICAVPIPVARHI